MWLDSHCHVTADSFAEDFEAVLERAVAEGVEALIGRSFGPIYERNAINAGLPVLVVDLIAAGVATGDVIRVDLASGQITWPGGQAQAEYQSLFAAHDDQGEGHTRQKGQEPAWLLAVGHGQQKRQVVEKGKGGARHGGRTQAGPGGTEGIEDCGPDSSPASEEPERKGKDGQKSQGSHQGRHKVGRLHRRTGQPDGE